MKIALLLGTGYDGAGACTIVEQFKKELNEDITIFCNEKNYYAGTSNINVSPINEIIYYKNLKSICQDINKHSLIIVVTHPILKDEKQQIEYIEFLKNIKIKKMVLGIDRTLRTFKKNIGSIEIMNLFDAFTTFGKGKIYDYLIKNKKEVFLYDCNLFSPNKIMSLDYKEKINQ